MSLTKQELMECSNETLALWYNMIEEECARRKLNLDAILLHPGNVVKGKPVPLLVRVLKQVGGLGPSDLAKVETLLTSWRTP